MRPHVGIDFGVMLMAGAQFSWDTVYAPCMRVRRRFAAMTAAAVATVSIVALAVVPITPSSAAPEADHAKVTVLTSTAKTPYTPQAINGGTDDYHCTLIDPKATHNSFIVSSQFFPGSGPSVKEVHHAILFLVPPNLVDAARTADNGGQGWTCFGEPPVLGKGLGQFLSMPWLSAWAPGHGKDVMPVGTGTPLPAHSLIIMQVHYNLLSGDLPVKPRAELDTVAASTGLRPTAIQPLVSTPNIPCPSGVTGPLCDRKAEIADLTKRFGTYMALFDMGMEAICGKNPSAPPEGNTTTCVWHIAKSGYIVRVAPHMHLLGTAMSITLNPGTAHAKSLMNVPRYNFDYQKSINLNKWVKVTAGETVKVSCTYNPRLAQQLPSLRKLPPHYITWGDGSSDEMCLGLMWEVPTAAHTQVDWSHPTGGLNIGAVGSGHGAPAWEHSDQTPPSTTTG